MSLRATLPKATRRAFWAPLYARRRLLTEHLAPLAAPHYALIGERLGYRPNGFFDPLHYRRQAPGASSARDLLEHYLSQPEGAGPSPSSEFDQAWYADQNPDWSRSHPHPFLHFLEAGLPSGKRPRADIDVAFLRDVIRGKRRSLEEAAFRVFDRPPPREGEFTPPLNRQELRARQDRFFAAGQLRIERELKPTGRRRLVYIQSGKRLDPAILSEPRAYDVLLNYYDQSPPNAQAETVVYQRGCKNTAIRRLLELRPDLLLSHDRVLFLDDDIEIEAAQIDLMFAVAEREELDLAGPSLTADSQTAWPFLKQPGAGAGIMRVSSIEIMAPLMTRRALETVAWVFAESASGWGGDLLLGPVVRAAFGAGSLGVIGPVPVRHARPVDTKGGTLYLYLRSYGIETGHEANRIAFDFGVDRFLRPLSPGEIGPVCRRPQGIEYSFAQSSMT